MTIERALEIIRKEIKIDEIYYRGSKPPIVQALKVAEQVLSEAARTKEKNAKEYETDTV